MAHVSISLDLRAAPRGLAFTAFRVLALGLNRLCGLPTGGGSAIAASGAALLPALQVVPMPPAQSLRSE